MECNETDRCINCHEHFKQLMPLVKEVLVSKHFLRDAPDFDIKLITDCKSEQFTHLHKFEKSVNGSHIFRALIDKMHIVYAIDKDHRLIFLRAFHNFKEYKKFLFDKKKISSMI